MMEHSLLEWFDCGIFAFPAVPENTATGEILIGSLYRELGLTFSKESEVGRNSTLLKDRLRREAGSNEKVTSPSGLKSSDRLLLFDSLLAAPRLKNQDDKKSDRYLNLSPLLPNFANYSAVARYQGNPWNPGRYIVSMVVRECGEEAVKILDSLRLALSVVEDSQSSVADDVWTRFLFSEISALESEEARGFQGNNVKVVQSFISSSNRLVEDIPHLIALKSLMTRRRWISLLESYFRYIVALDVLWICSIHHQLPLWIERSYSTLDLDYIDKDFKGCIFFKSGQRRDDVVQFYTREYARSSLLNYGLVEFANSKGVSFEKPFGVTELYAFIEQFRKVISIEEFASEKRQLVERIDREQISKVTGKSSRTKSLSEFLTYAPGRRNTAVEAQSSYDQGYWYRKSGSHKSAPWLFEMGPGSLCVMVYLCCCYNESVSISAQDFIDFLGIYGIELSQKELSAGITGRHLRTLGLIIDSPDSEGGIVISRPF